MWPRRFQNPFCTNIVMFKSKVMKSRIQWCKKFALGGGGGGGGGACLGVTRGQEVGFWVFFFYCHMAPPRLFELEP